MTASVVQVLHNELANNRDVLTPVPLCYTCKQGICLDEQIVQSVPVSAHDVQLDYVVTPTRVFKRSPP
jgi:5-formyltetrahydrofolate cyclo-ligase